MPFIRKIDPQGVQPPIDTRTLFIGRTGELLFFVQNILKPEEPTHNILSISGQGGVGKSTLLARFIAETHTPNFREHCLAALVDERQTSAVSIMQKFADQLRLEGEFKKAMRQYEEALLKLKADQENGTLHDVALDGVPNFAGAAVEGVPFVGPLLREGVKATAQYLLARYYTNLARGDAERLLDPLADLTRALVEDLNRLVSTTMVSGSRQISRRRVILFFDTIEQLADVAAPWLLENFLQASISSNIVLVIAGRTPIEHATSDPKRWLPYYDSETIYSISLNSFTQDETSDYLAERGITDPNRIQTIWHLSRGLPLYLGLLTSNPRGEVDPAKDVVVNFLRWIPEHDQIKRRLVLDAALFSRPFTQDDLEAFKYVTEDERFALFDWLTGLPFVRSQEGRYRYHEMVQELFGRHLFQRSKKEYYATRRAIANYYQQEGEKERDDTDESLELVLALTYQLLLLPDEASHIRAIEYALKADRHVKQSGEIVNMLCEVSQEQLTNLATASAKRTAGQLLQYIEADLESQEFITAANDLLAKIAQEPASSAEMLSRIYRARGLAYRRLEEYGQAIADFDRAIALNPTRADFYRSRGKAYRELKNYVQAFADFDYAITLSPNDASLFYVRGLIFREHRDYKQAIADFDRVIALQPEDADVYRSRGKAYRELGNFRQAIIDYNNCIQLDPLNVRALVQRGSTFRKLKDYSRAIEDFTHALEIDPKDVWAYAERGHTYYELQNYPQAIEDFDRALKLDPKYAWAWSRRGHAYLRMKNTEQAKYNFARRWELDQQHINAGWMAEWSGMCDERPDSGMTQRLETIAAGDPQDSIAYVCRGVARYLQKSFEQSLTELEQTITLKSEEWDAYFWKGMVCAALKRDEDAKAALEKSLEVDMPPVLLAPLRWFEQDRPDFYEHFVAPLLARYV